MQFNKIKKGQTIFAVTDQNVLMPLVVSNVENDVEDLEGWLEVTTKLSDEEASRHQSSHHQAYFKKLLIEPDGTSSRAGVFDSKEAAIEYAEMSIDSELRILQSRMEALHAKRAKLRNG